MPANVTDSSTFTSPIVVPTDGDTRNAASVLTAFQGLANRTKYPYDFITNGVPKIRFASNATALKALTGMTDKEACLVPMVGLFFFRSGAAGSEVGTWLYPADDASGYWYNALVSLYDVGGFSGTDPRLNTATIRVANSILYHRTKTITSPSSTSMTFDGSGDYITTLTTDNYTSLQNGDVVSVWFSADSIEPNDTGGAAITLDYSVDNGGSWTEITYAKSMAVIAALPASARRFPISTMVTFGLTAGQTQVSFRVRGKGSAAGTALLYGAYRFAVLITRP